jgi:hypothetical protein
MKTTTLLLAAAVGSALATTGMAQVYSVNAVGYVNLEINPGFTMICNPLDAGEGMNTVGNVLADAPVGTSVYKYDAGTGAYAINNKLPPGWQNAAMSLAPGEGVFIQNKGAAAFTVTTVGEVMQGTLSNQVPLGFSILSSMVPQAGALDTVLGFPAQVGDVVYRFNNGTGQYSIHTKIPVGWNGGAPEIGVGEAFFVKAAAAKTWTREFSVNTP